MRILAIDTSTWWGGVALVEDDRRHAPQLVAELGLRVPDTHESRLLDRVDFLLAEAGWIRAEIDGFAATIGPGSFTGIRVGLGTLQGLALAAERPCAGVGTLDALVEAHGPAEHERVALLDAGRGEVYAARFDAASSPPLVLVPPRVGRLELLAGPAPFVAVLGPTRHRELRERLLAAAPGARPTAPTRGLAAAAGRLAALGWRRGPAAPLAPLYLRPPDAKPPAAS